MSEQPNSQPEQSDGTNPPAPPAPQQGNASNAADPQMPQTPAAPQYPQPPADVRPAGSEFWTPDAQGSQAAQPQPTSQYPVPPQPQPTSQYPVPPQQPYSTAQYPGAPQAPAGNNAGWGQPSYWTPPTSGPSEQGTTPGYGTPQYGTPQYGPQQYGYPAGQYGAQQYGTQQYGTPQYGYPAAQYGDKKPLQRKRVLGGIGAAMVLALAVGVVSYSAGVARRDHSSPTSFTTPNGNSNGSNGSSTDPFGGSGSSGSGSSGSGSSGSGSSGSGSSGSGSSGGFGWSNPFGGSGNGFGGSGSGSTASASSTQSVGVVDVNTVLDFGSGRAAGTGMVLTSDGEILTNNHVVDGSTSIQVTVVSTNKTYTATVVGTDPTDDVAVIKLQNASGLATAKLGDSSGVKTGDNVTAVGNAGGTGGTPSAATGQVTGLNQSITASDGDGSNAEHLTGMIQINAAIQPGDSGGPLYDSSNKIIGIDTAASSDSSSQTVGFAIPINKALGIAKQIENGNASTTIHLGYPAFLGVQLSADSQISTNGVPVAGVVSNSAAAKAGMQAGDTITAVGGSAVSSDSSLSSVLGKHKPGDQVKITWVDSSGQSHSSTVTLGQGPAD